MICTYICDANVQFNAAPSVQFIYLNWNLHEVYNERWMHRNETTKGQFAEGQFASREEYNSVCGNSVMSTVALKKLRKV